MPHVNERWCICVRANESAVGIEPNKSVNQLCTVYGVSMLRPLNVFVHCMCACVRVYCDVLKLLSAVIRLPFAMKLAPQVKSTPMGALTKTLKILDFLIFFLEFVDLFKIRPHHYGTCLQNIEHTQCTFSCHSNFLKCI